MAVGNPVQSSAFYPIWWMQILHRNGLHDLHFLFGDCNGLHDLHPATAGKI